MIIKAVSINYARDLMSNNNELYFGKNNYVVTAFDDILGHLNQILSYPVITETKAKIFQIIL